MTRQDLYKLIDQLREDELDKAADYLQSLCEQPRVPARCDIPFDDEPLTGEDIQALDEAHADVAAGRLSSHEEVKREFGLQ